MKKASRALSLILSALMVLSCFAGFTFAFAEDEIGYAADGLVALFDGKVGDGDKWVDRVSGYSVDVANDDKNGFNEEGYVNNSVKNYFPQEIVDLVNGDEFTVELALGEFISIGGDFNTFLNSTNDRFALFRRVAKNELEFKFAGCGGDLRWTVADALNIMQDATISVTYDADGVTACYINGAKVTEKAAQGKMGAEDLFIGQEGNKAYETTYKSIRFYNRVLTDEEIAANYAYDLVYNPAAEEEPEEPNPYEFTEIEKIVLGTHDGDPFPPHAAGQSFAVKTNVAAGRRLASICAGDMATYSAPCGEVLYQIFQWNKDYDTTVAGEPLWSYTEYDHADNATVVIPLDNTLFITGDVLIVFTCIEAQAGITPWHTNMQPENTTFFDNGVECANFTFVIETAKLPTKTVVKSIDLTTGGQGNPHGNYGPGQSCAFKYDLPAGTILNSVTFTALATYGDAVENSVKVDVYNWDTDYATTVAGEPIASKTETPHIDCQDFVVDLGDGIEVAGPVLAVATYLSGPQALTPWAVTGTGVEGATFYANGNEAVPFRAAIRITAEEPLDPPDPLADCPDPTYVIDFGKYIEDVDAEFGFQYANQVTYDKLLNSGYITFTPNGGDPYVYMSNLNGLFEIPCKDVKYFVMKYRSFGAAASEVFVARTDGVNPGAEGSHIAFDIIPDANWHLAIVDASEVWGNADAKFTQFRLDPVCGSAISEIDVAYIAFFSNYPALQAAFANDVQTVHVKGELTEGNPAILPFGGFMWNAQNWFELKQNFVEVEPATTSIDADTVISMSPDTYRVNGENVRDGAAHDYIATELGGKIDNSDYSKETIGFRGWAWPNDGGEVADFGYSLNDGEIVWGGEVSLDEGIIPILNNEQVRRFIITIPTTAAELADGTYNVYMWVKSSNGDINRLGAWNDFQLIQGDGITRKLMDGLADDAGNTYSLKGQRVLDAKGIDTGLIAWNLDDGRLVAASTMYMLTYQDPMSGAIDVDGAKYVYDEKIAVTDVVEPVLPADSDVWGDFTAASGHCSCDTFFLNGATVINNGQAQNYIKDTLGGKIVSVNGSVADFGVRGWFGSPDGGEIEAYGYALNGGEPVFNAEFIKTAEDAVIAAAGTEFATRYEITIPTEGLEVGTYNVAILVKFTSGSVERLSSWGDFKLIITDAQNLIGYTDGTTTYGVDSVIFEDNGTKYVLINPVDVSAGIIDYNTVVDSYEVDMGTAVIVNENDPGWGEGYTWPDAGYTVAGNKMVNLWGANGQVIFESLPFADYNTVEIIVGSDPSCSAFRVGFVKDVAHLYGVNQNGVDDMAADLISAVAPAGSEGQPNLSGRGEGAGWNSVERLVRLDISGIDYAAPVAISVGSVAPHTMVVAKVTFVNYAQEPLKGKYVFDQDIITAKTPKAPVNPADCQPVYILDGEALAPLSPNGIEEAEYDYANGCIRYTSTKGDPNAGNNQIPAGTVVARYMAVKYRTEVSCIGECFIGTANGASGPDRVGYPSYINDGEWHYFIVDLTASAEYDTTTNVINHFRNDCVQGAGDWVEIEFYAFFDDADKAAYFCENDLHVLPQPPKTFTATFKADGKVIGTVEFKEGAKVLTGIPKVPAKEGYKGTWEKYTLADADIVINAVYTSTGEETEPTTEAPTEEPTEALTEEPTEAPTDAKTEAPTSVGTEASTEAETKPGKKGCKSVVAASGVIALVAVFGAAFVAKKKKED